MLALKVTHAFGDHAVGETITDKAVMRAVQETNPAFVVRVHLAEMPAGIDARSGDHRVEAAVRVGHALDGGLRLARAGEVRSLEREPGARLVDVEHLQRGHSKTILT